MEWINLVELLRWRAHHQADRRAYTFLVDGEANEAHLSYGELDQQARAIGAYLQTLGAAGERVLLLYPPGLAYITAFFGCLYADALAVPLYPPRSNRPDPRLQAVLKDAQPKIALTENSIWTNLAQRLVHTPDLAALEWLVTDTLDQNLAESWQDPGLPKDTLAFLQYTSGSTAAPKGVMVSHSNLLHNLEALKQALEFQPSSVSVTWVPGFHDMGLIGGILQPLYTGCLGVLMSPLAFLQQPIRWLRAISRYQATHSGGPNFAYNLCARMIMPDQLETLELSSWRSAYSGAEPVHKETLEQFAAKFKPYGFRASFFYPSYGMAEATLMISGGLVKDKPIYCTVEAAALKQHRVVEAAELTPNARQLVGCGRSWLDTKIVIADPETLTLCTPDTIGEIWVSGSSVAQGYWNRPEATQDTFRAYLADTGEGPFLRTGDLGFLRDKELFITGRLKDVIIIRGRNHYPQDIELTIADSHPALQPDSGAAFSVTIEDEERLVIVQEVTRHYLRQPNLTEVLGAVQQAVAEQHELQVYALLLLKPGSIPKTSSGKIQRYACRAGFLEGSLAVVEQWQQLDEPENTETTLLSSILTAAPLERERLVSTQIQQQVARLLGVSPAQVNMQQSWPNLGLDSLRAVELRNWFSYSLEIDVPVTELIASLSLADLAAELAEAFVPQARSGSAPTRVAGPQLELFQTAPAATMTPSEYPLSYNQQGLWFLYQHAPDSAAFNIAFTVRIRSQLDVPALRRAFQALITRHPMLRTTFSMRAGQPIQTIWADTELYFEEVKASGWSWSELNEQVRAAYCRPFNLEQGPVLRVNLFTYAEQDAILLLTIHHIVCDGWSLETILNELPHLYQAEVSGKPASPPPVLAYTDFIEWQRQMLAGPEAEQLWAYWQKQLADEPLLNLPLDHTRQRLQTHRGATHTFTLSEDLTRQLKVLSQAEEATLFMTLLATFQILLSRYSSQTTVVVGSPTAGRSRPEFAGLVGCFINLIALRADLAGNPSFKALLYQVRQTVLAGLKHQDFPLPLLVERLQPTREAGRTSLFQVVFGFHNQMGQMIDLFAAEAAQSCFKWGAFEVEPFSIAQQEGQYDMSLEMGESGGRLFGGLKYNPDLFEPTTISCMAGHFQTLLAAIVANPGQGIAQLPLLTEAERRQLLVEWNDSPGDDRPDLCLHQRFEAQAARTPEAVAVVFEAQRLTYRELNSRTNQLAHYLQTLGVSPDVLVGLWVERSLEMVVGLLAILKAGGAYVPLDPTYPPERLAFFLADTQATVLLTQAHLLEKLPEPVSAGPARNLRIICLDRDWPVIAGRSEENPVSEVKAHNLAYVIYTSGSTGLPKGVLVTHANVLRLFTATETWFNFNERDVWSLFHSYAFDFSVWEFWGALLYGGRLVVVPYWVSRSAEAFHTLLGTEGVTVLNQTPSAFRQLMQVNASPEQSRNLALRLIIFGGEALELSSLKPWFERYGDQTPQLVNMYGITETTVHVTYYPLTLADLNHSGSVIGRPIPDLQVYILDPWLQPVPVGVPGELYVGGAGLARGYLNNPELTAEKFIPHPFRDAPGAHLYKTGDVGRFLPNGDIEYQGRLDNQVKLRGFRIELGEIEASLNQHPAVQESVVLSREDGPDHKRLVAYIVPDQRAASPLLRLLQLEKEGLLSQAALYELPNGMAITYLNKTETEFVYQEIFAEQTYLKHGLTLSEGACVFDVGANIGLFTLFAHQACPNLSFYAFEPVPPVFEKLRLNTAIYGVKAKLFNYGLANEARQDTLTYYPNISIVSGRLADPAEEREMIKSYLLKQHRLDENGTDLSAEMLDELLAERLHSEPLTCQFRTLSEVMLEHGLERIDLLKIDVEKSELEMLAGIQAEDWPKIKQIVVEVHHFNHLQQIIALLEDKGYTWKVDQDNLLEDSGLYNVYAFRSDASRPVDSIMPAKSHWSSVNGLVKDLRKFLHAKLPDYMLPSAFVLLERLPLTTNGKLDRAALPAPEAADTGLNSSYRLPRTPTEASMAAIWAEVLRLERLGPDDNFFELGGHSLLATQLIARIRDTFRVNISLRQLFETPILAGLAAAVDEAARHSQALPLPAFEPVARAGPLPLSFAQQRLWFLDQLGSGPAYNIPAVLKLSGPLNVGALEQALQEIVRRHEVLRTTFTIINDEARQVVTSNIVTLPVVDLQYLPLEEQVAAVNRLQKEAAMQPFDLGRDLMLRASLLRLEPKTHLLPLTLHHIAADGWSLGVFITELATLYAAFAQGQPSPLPALPRQYADFVYWQRQWLQGEALAQQLDYWQKQLADAPTVLQLPTDHPRPAMQTFRGGLETFALSADLTRQLKRLSLDSRATLFMTLLAAFKVLLSRYSGQEDVLVGTPIANRNRPEIEPLIGFFANTLVLRTDLSDNPTFQNLLERVSQVTQAAYEHQDLPFEKVVEALQPERNLGHNPLVQVLFVLQNAPLPPLQLAGLSMSQLAFPEVQTVRFDLELHFWEAVDGLQGCWLYNSDLFEAATIRQMAAHLQTLLAEIVAGPEQRLSELSWLRDGALELTGAVRRQVWLNGERFSLAEVEAALLDEPTVAECRVTVRETDLATRELVAYVVPNGAFSALRLQAHLAAALPASMRPAAVAPVSNLPLRPNGTVDESALNRLAIITPDLAGLLEAQLRAVPEIQQAVVVIEEDSQTLPPLHLADLLPQEHTRLQRTNEESPRQPAHETVRPELAQPQVMALSDGGPLIVPEEAPRTLSEALLQTAARYKEKVICYIQPDGSTVTQTYPALLAEAKCLLTGLSGMGLGPGDRVILQIESLRDYFPMFWACVLGGITPVTVAIAPSYTPDNSVVGKLFNTWQLLGQPPIIASDPLVESLANLKHSLGLAEWRVWLISDLRHHPPAEQIYPSQPHEVVFFQLTSGSTGVPKAIQETHQGIICHIQGSTQFNAYQADDVSLNWLPIDHVVPILTYHLKDVYLGCQQIQVPTATVLVDPLKWLDLIETYRVTHSWSPNFGYKLVSDHLAKGQNKRWDLSSIKFFMNAGEQVTLPVVQNFLKSVVPFGVPAQAMQPAFGMAEICTCMTYQNNFEVTTGIHWLERSSLEGRLRQGDQADPAAVNFVDLGPPIRGVQIRIVDQNNQLLPEGVIGRFQIKGAVVTPGYYGNPAANQEAFVGDGWFNSGDLGFILNGRLTITGREKEMIIIRGTNYYCYEIEDIVNRMTGVEPTYVGACALDDLDTGTEELAIFFSPTVESIAEKSHLSKTIRSQVASNLGISPAYVVPVAKQEFPKTTSGKIQRTQLKKRLATGHFREVLREIDIYLENNNTVPDWFYRKIWRQKEATPLLPHLPTGLYLVFLDSSGVGAAVCAALQRNQRPFVQIETGVDFEKIDSDYYRLAPGNPEHYRRLLEALAAEGRPVAQVLHLWTYGAYSGEVTTARALEQAQEPGLYSLLSLFQALVKAQGQNQPVKLYLISSHSQLVLPTDSLTYEKAPVLGLLKTMPQEIPWLACRHVDLPLDVPQANATRLFRELQTRSAETEVAYRDGRRLIPRLEKVEPAWAKKQALPFKPGGMYLISGGLGGIGVEIAAYLLKHYQARLLLLGRTKLTEPNTEEQRLEAYRALQQLGGDVSYQAVDIGDWPRLQQVVEQAQTQWECELAGVIHLAGIFQEKPLVEETQENLAATLRPKMLGAWGLYQLVKNKPGSLFITFASVNGFFGGVGVGAYAAANSFLTAFADFQQAGDAVDSYCFSWSMWDELGMSRQYHLKALSQKRGYYPIPTQQGLYSFLAGLGHGQSQVMVGLDGSNQRIRRQTELKAYGLQKLTTYFTTQDEASAAARLSALEARDRFGRPASCNFIQVEQIPLTETGEIDRNQLRASTSRAAQRSPARVAPRTETERLLATIWQGVLGVPEVGIHDNFFELGGDSLLATQIVAQLQGSLRVDLPLRRFLERPTVAGVAEYIEVVSHFTHHASAPGSTAPARERIEF